MRPLLTLIVALALLSCQQEKTAAASSEKSTVLRDARGTAHHLFVPNAGVKATVAVFLMTDCPVANAMLPDLNEIASRYEPLGIRFYGIFADEEPEDILRHGKDYRIPFPCVLDDAGLLAGRSGASRVPEAAIFGPDGRSLYCGRIDDRAVKPGRMKPEPAERNLADALDALLAGRELPAPRPATAGCFLSHPQIDRSTQSPSPSNP